MRFIDELTGLNIENRIMKTKKLVNSTTNDKDNKNAKRKLAKK